MAYKQSNNPLSRKSSPINFHEPKDAEYADRISHGTGETRREINAKRQKRAKKGVKKGPKKDSPVEMNVGGLHRYLGIPEDEKIPMHLKEKAARSSNERVRKMGQFAVNMAK